MKKILPALLSALLLCLLPSCASALFDNELYSDKQCQKNGGTAQRFQAAAGFLITHSRLLMMSKVL